jgi:hypothetical protein
LSSLTIPRTRLALPCFVSMTRHILCGGNIRPFAVKDFKGKWQSFSRCHRADCDLGAVGTAVAVVTPFCLKDCLWRCLQSKWR